ncbi:MAG: hypothetical protein ACRCXK_13970 [Wohlfahrtiimonas sp.]
MEKKTIINALLLTSPFWVYFLIFFSWSLAPKIFFHGAPYILLCTIPLSLVPILKSEFKVVDVGDNPDKAKPSIFLKAIIALSYFFIVFAFLSTFMSAMYLGYP